MKAIGIDVGTTSICAVLADSETGELLESVTIPNISHMSSEDGKGFERLQNPTAIIEAVSNVSFLSMEDVQEIGVTGQMHGMLYLDASGAAASPLYTWQDGRGDNKFKDGLTYAEYLSNETGYRCATGYGLVTHFYNIKNGLVPENAVSLCTIGDYVAAFLAGVKKPLMHASNAHSIGFFDIDRGFNITALEKAGICPSFLPDASGVVSEVGKTASGITVKTAVGDNQASVYGAAGIEDAVVVNVGTGSQISVISKNGCSDAVNTETRPYFDDKTIFVGSALMGGDAYALLERFFAQTAVMLGHNPADNANIYEKMDNWLKLNPPSLNGLTVDTRFKGTRRRPDIRGGVYGVNCDNFTPEALIHGFLEGIVNELWELYAEIPKECETARFIGSGNGIRKNKYLRGLFEKRFGALLAVSPYEEEAAYGAALCRK